MLTQLKATLQEGRSSDGALIRLMKLILRECVETHAADTIVFGAPPDDRPREQVYPSMVSGEAHDRPAQPIHSGGGMPVWFLVGGRWRQVEAIPLRLIPEFISVLADHSSLAEDSTDLERTHVVVDESESARKYVQYRLCVEANFCFSIHVTEAIDLPS